MVKQYWEIILHAALDSLYSGQMDISESSCTSVIVPRV